MLAIAFLPFLAFATSALAAPAAPADLETRTWYGGLPGGFDYREDLCLQNAPANLDGKLFKGDTFTDLAMTQAKCAQFCYDKGWQAAGIEDAKTCSCGAVTDLERIIKKPLEDCNTDCPVDFSWGPREKCGGHERLSILTTTQTKPAPPAPKVYAKMVVPGQPAWQYQAQCNRDNNPYPLMEYASWDLKMTYTKCAAKCEGKGKNLAGIGGGFFCYCADASEFNGKHPEGSDRCTIPCPGDKTKTQLCGGWNALSIMYRGGENAIV